jgi:predicted extracellular nuclease
VPIGPSQTLSLVITRKFGVDKVGQPQEQRRHASVNLESCSLFLISDYLSYPLENIMNKTLLGLIAALAAVGAAPAHAAIQITEWMYSPGSSSGEFVEFTNLGLGAVDFSGWSFDDNSQTPGSESLSAFGIVQAGESVIITESDASVFRAEWNLSAAIKVIGGITNNLGRSDEINLYDNSNMLVDRLTYNDQGAGNVDGPRTQGVSGNPGSLAMIGANTASQWVLSSIGDAEGSWSALGNGDIGNPGTTSFAAPVPEAETYAMMLAGLALVGVAVRKRQA